MQKVITSIIMLCTFIMVGCSKEVAYEPVTVNAKGAMIVETRNGRVLFEKNATEKYPPASTVKVMTAILAVENIPLDETIVPSKKALYVEPTIAGLREGVEYKLKDLILAILIKSANDAARVIAEAVAGSQEEFAKMMNNKAKEIGMENTYFVKASGLPTGKKDKQYTTAKDLTRMMRYAAQYEVILEAMSKKEANISGSDGRNIYLKTHNKALLRDGDAPWGKTGYTREARRTFAGVDPSLNPCIAFGLLKSTALWDDIRTLKTRGLEIYEIKSKTFISDLIEWVKNARESGRETLEKIKLIKENGHIEGTG